MFSQEIWKWIRLETRIKFCFGSLQDKHHSPEEHCEFDAWRNRTMREKQTWRQREEEPLWFRDAFIRGTEAELDEWRTLRGTQAAERGEMSFGMTDKVSAKRCCLYQLFPLCVWLLRRQAEQRRPTGLGRRARRRGAQRDKKLISSPPRPAVLPSQQDDRTDTQQQEEMAFSFLRWALRLDLVSLKHSDLLGSEGSGADQILLSGRPDRQA